LSSSKYNKGIEEYPLIFSAAGRWACCQGSKAKNEMEKDTKFTFSKRYVSGRNRVKVKT